MSFAIIFVSVLAVVGWGLLTVFLIRTRRKNAVPQAPSLVLTEWDRKFMAVHEAGHAVVQMALFGADSIRCVSIDPSADGFGCMQPQENPNHNQTRSGLIDEMAVALAGRLAEEMVLHETTTSIIHDLQKVRFLTKGMVTEWAMGDHARYLEFDPASASETRKQKIESEMLQIMQEAETKSIQILTERPSLLKT